MTGFLPEIPTGLGMNNCEDYELTVINIYKEITRRDR